MPFINGRYYINPTIGHAIEAARAAEQERQDAEHGSQHDGTSTHDDVDWNDEAHSTANHAHEHDSIHRIEIEAAELVPSHSGRAARGFVARVHRTAIRGSENQNHPHAAGPASTHAESHVFTDHRDLVNFLRDELAHDCAAHSG